MLDGAELLGLVVDLGGEYAVGVHAGDADPDGFGGAVGEARAAVGDEDLDVVGVIGVEAALVAVMAGIRSAWSH